MLPLQKILKIIDLGKPEDLGLANCFALAKRLGAELHLLHVVTPNSVPTFGSGNRARTAGDQLMSLQLPDTSVPVFRTVHEGDLNSCVKDYVQKRQIDLLVVDDADTSALGGKPPQAIVSQLREQLPIPILFTDSAGERGCESVHQASQLLVEEFGEEFAGDLDQTLYSLQRVLQVGLNLDDDHVAILVAQLQELRLLTWNAPVGDSGDLGYWVITSLQLPSDVFAPAENEQIDPERSSAVSLIQRAIEVAATDIHIDPIEQEYTVQFRVDGRMHEFCRLEPQAAGTTMKQIKLMADISLADPFHPSESRLQLPDALSDYEVRVTTAPVAEGEAIAMRIFNSRNLNLPLGEIGLSSASFASVYRMLHQRSGLVLIAGPTGAGKTTTAYSILNVLFNEMQKIVSIEDPVELVVPFMRQLAVDHKHDFTMRDALSTTLRMDPDIVFIGEIRDAMAARVAMQAAASGKRTISTIHLKDVSATVSAMREFDVDGRTLADSIAGVIAQRLVRRICSACHQRTPITQDEAGIFESQNLTPPGDLVRSRGCAKCRGTGYRGRIGIFEAVVIEGQVAEAIRQEVHESELRKVLSESGVGLVADGLQKVIDGMTTLEELKETSWLVDSVEIATRFTSDEIYERSAGPQ